MPYPGVSGTSLSSCVSVLEDGTPSIWESMFGRLIRTNASPIHERVVVSSAGPMAPRLRPIGYTTANRVVGL
jgi:hypothetical protein